MSATEPAAWIGSERPLATRLFERTIRHGGTVIDAGAGAGRLTLLAARRVGPRGRVLAFEPDPDAYRALRRNVRAHGYAERVTALPLGLGEWSDRRPVSQRSNNHATNGSLLAKRWWEAADAATTSLDAQVGGCCIDVLRLDVHGAELGALRGMKLTLELCPEIEIFVRCDPDALLAAGASVPMLLEELQQLGFESSVIDEPAGRLAPTGPWLWDARAAVDLHCTRVGRLAA